MDKLFAFLMAFFISGVIAVPSDVLAKNDDASTNIVLQKNQTINKDYFAAGDSVTLSGTVNGDAYIAGGNILVEGDINGDLLAAGGTITMRGKVRDNVRVLGGQIIISGDVGRNVTTLGGSVTIADAATINGSLAAGTGNLSLFAPIGKEANFAAGQATIGNTINGDVQAGVGQLMLTPSAKIFGSLTYWSEQKAQIDSNAQVSGKTIHNLPPQEMRQDPAKDTAAATGFFTFFTLVSFISTLILGLLLVKFLPVYTKQTANALLQKPFLTLGVGFLSVIIVPIFAIFLLITVLGIPLGLILLVSFFIMVYLAKLFVGVALGTKILQLLNKKASLSFAFMIGLIAYYVLTLIPLLGFIFWMIAGLMGLGAILIERKQMYTSLRKKNLI